MNTPGNDRIESLEQDLLRSLRPVQPNPEFVTHLRRRLATPATTVVESRPAALTSLVLFILGLGLAVGLFLVWVVRQLR